MKINNIILKIYNKINDFFKLKFGRSQGAEKILKIFISFFYALDYSYYLSDFKVPRIVSLFLAALAIYLGLSILVFILKYVFTLVQRIRPKNLAVYVLLFIGLSYFIDKLFSLDLNEVLYFLLIFAVLTGLVIFAKALISLFKNDRPLSLIFIVPLGVFLCAFIYFLIMPGFKRESIPETIEKTSVAEKSATGDVKILSYDGGTRSLSSYVSYSGMTKKVRDFYWKNNLSKAPLRGEVYLPKDEKNVPILFIVHGNHRMTTDSHLGYEYLGKYLAQRGIATVSVDMNILNGFLSYSLSNENDARAILLLENIKYLLEENRNKDSEFFGAFDPQNICLLGHSRGGEAVSIAYKYNSLTDNPDRGNIKFDYNFNIKGLIGLAPTYSQFKPADKDLILKDVNYLTLAGTNDYDVSGFEGMMQYDNVKFSKDSDKFKAAIYIAYANHGNFNSKWGDFDSEPIEGLNINRRELIDSLSQERILCLYTYNFLENIFEKSFDRSLFKNGPYKYKDFPETQYYARYSDSSFYNIGNFEEDVDLRTIGYKDDYADYKNFINIREGAHQYGDDYGNNNALFLNSRKGASYKIFLRSLLEKRKFLVFDINKLDELKRKNSLKILISDMWGESSQIELKDYFSLVDPAKIYLTKTDYLFDEPLYYSTPTSVRIELEEFKKKNPKINLEEINRLEFIFDGDMGEISLDNIGLEN